MSRGEVVVRSTEWGLGMLKGWDMVRWMAVV